MKDLLASFKEFPGLSFYTATRVTECECNRQGLWLGLGSILFRDSKTRNAIIAIQQWSRTTIRPKGAVLKQEKEFAKCHRGLVNPSLIFMTLVLVISSPGLLRAQGGSPVLSVVEKKTSALDLNEKGVIELKAGHLLQAAELFQRALRLQSDLAVANSNLGATYNALGRYQEAIDCLEQALRSKPNYAEAHYNLGFAYLRLDQYRDAVAAYKEALRFAPNFAEAQNSLGVAYNNWGKRDEATRSYQRAIQLKPDYAEAYNNLGTVQAEMGHYKQAMASFRNAITIKPSLAVAHYNFGVALLQAKDRSAAIEQYKTLSDLSEVYATKLYNGIYRGRILAVAKR